MMKRSSNKMANWDLASPHSRGGIFHSAVASRKTSQISFVAASSVGKWPRNLTARRNFAFKASMEFVTGMRMAGADVLPRRCDVAYAASIRDRGTGSTKVRAGRCIR